MQLTKILTRGGRHSIPEVQHLLNQNRIKVNGQVAREDLLVPDWTQPIELDEQRVEITRPGLWMYNKRQGEITNNDLEDLNPLDYTLRMPSPGSGSRLPFREILKRRFPKVPSVWPVEPMVDDSEGVLLLTSAGLDSFTFIVSLFSF